MNCNSRIPGGALSSAFGGSKFLNGKLSLSSEENRPAPYNCRQANQTAALAGKEAFP